MIDLATLALLMPVLPTLTGVTLVFALWKGSKVSFTPVVVIVKSYSRPELSPSLTITFPTLLRLPTDPQNWWVGWTL